MEVLAPDRPSLGEAAQRGAHPAQLLLPLLQLSVVRKVGGGREGQAVLQPHHPGEQDHGPRDQRLTQRPQLEEAPTTPISEW